jgi:hypothetical protein
MEMPFNPKEWSNTIPAWLMAFGFLVGVVVWAAKQVVAMVRQFNGNSADTMPGHKTFADDEDHYWNKMREVVTQPLGKVLEGTNEILREMRDRDIKEDGRREAERQRRRG